MFSSLKKKARGLFEHKDSYEVHEHEEDELKKSEEFIADKSSNDNTKPGGVNHPDEEEKASEKAEKKSKKRRDRFAYEPHASFDY